MTTAESIVGFLKTNGIKCRCVSMLTETEPKLKPGCPFQGVLKVSRRRGILNANYNTSVRKLIAKKLGVKTREVEYQDGEVWYRHLMTDDGKPLPLVLNKKVQIPSADTDYYLQFFLLVRPTIIVCRTARL